MEKWGLFAVTCIIASHDAGSFLFYYYTLVRSNQKVIGEIVNFEPTNTLFNLRPISVPVVCFRTEHNEFIESRPYCTYLTKLNNFRIHGQVTVYYQKDKPENFVVESKKEVIANWLIIGITLFALVGLLTA